MTVDEMINEVIRREGGFVNNPADRGGPTKYGITQATLSEWRLRTVSSEDVRQLSVTEARDIYRRLYLERPGIDRIFDPVLQATVLDASVNHGPAAAIKLLQRALGNVKVDGVMGLATITETNGRDGRRLALMFCAERVAFYGRIISTDLSDRDSDGVPDNTEFAAGWLNRVSAIIRSLA